jgi:hypothetical protein
LEQIVLYLAVLAALAGFGMGLLNLAGPFLKRRGSGMPSISLKRLLRRIQTRDDDDDGFDLDDADDIETARDFAEASFADGNTSLLKRRLVGVPGYEDEELDEELVQVLEAVAEEEIESSEADHEAQTDEDGPFIYTVSAEVSDDGEDEEGDAEEASEEDDGDEGDEEEEEEEEDEEEPQAEVQVVAGGGEGDDMLSFFNEAADAGAAPAAAWRQDLPDVSIEELLAEARAIRQQIEGKKRNTA